MNVSAKRLKDLAFGVRRRVERLVFPYGNSVECPYCHWTGWRFLSGGLERRPNRLCPQCRAVERSRMIPLVLKREVTHPAPVVLELAPISCLTQYLTSRPGWRYVSSDIASPAAMVRADLCSMPFPSNTFDLIICFHVLEHIHDDGAAFREIGRLLTRDGIALICVPLRGDVTQEGAPREDWERLYGQNDHVRYYGIDIEQRMKSAGLRVKRIDTHSYFTPAELDRHALRGDDRYLFVVSK
jgi:SAM-dependent methyltransferase